QGHHGLAPLSTRLNWHHQSSPAGCGRAHTASRGGALGMALAGEVQWSRGHLTLPRKEFIMSPVPEGMRRGGDSVASHGRSEAAPTAGGFAGGLRVSQAGREGRPVDCCCSGASAGAGGGCAEAQTQVEGCLPSSKVQRDRKSPLQCPAAGTWPPSSSGLPWQQHSSVLSLCCVGPLGWWAHVAAPCGWVTRHFLPLALTEVPSVANSRGALWSEGECGCHRCHRPPSWSSPSAVGWCGSAPSVLSVPRGLLPALLVATSLLALQLAWSIHMELASVLMAPAARWLDAH
ncbi:Hypothetical predicted protein, partial [Marmota monax]